MKIFYFSSHKLGFRERKGGRERKRGALMSVKVGAVIGSRNRANPVRYLSLSSSLKIERRDFY